MNDESLAIPEQISQQQWERGEYVTQPRPRRQHATPKQDKKKDKQQSDARGHAVQQSDSERRRAWLTSGQLAVSLGHATPEQWMAFARRKAPDLFDPESPAYQLRAQAQADSDTAGEARPDEKGSNGE